MHPIVAARDLRKSWSGTLVLEHADLVSATRGGPA